MNLIRKFFFVTLLTAGIASLCSGQQRGLGLGVVLGEPTGISFKHWMTSHNAVDGAVSWSFVKEASFHVHVDYLWHSFDAIESKEPLCLYYGIGGRIKSSAGARLGVRGVIGFDYFIRSAPIDCFLEAAPIFDITPEMALGLNAGIGIRYFFE